jgi:putative oxygen-independent coproporphyrinogen III oxidase
VRGRSPAGLYVHVPFCLTRCGYCDFNTYARLGHLAGRYVAGLRTEARLHATGWQDAEFVSAFLGGGTPTMLPAMELVRLIADLRTVFPFAGDAEVTVEANPDTVDERYLASVREGGVSRLSLGVQSFDPAVLRALERVHSAEAAVRAFGAARRAGFDDVNLDLIYGANGESLESWRRTVDLALALEPEHLSCYALTIEPATALGRKVAAGIVPGPDPDLQSEMYELACETLAAAGYEHYEVSNWALPGLRCRHNLGYWDGTPYLGLGAGAHSYRADRRWWNVRPPQRYLELVEAGEVPIGGEERLTEDERRLEELMLGLRIAEGVPSERLDGEQADEMIGHGLAARRDGRIALTDRGLFVANELALQIAPTAP